jgi:hypothetical protein
VHDFEKTALLLAALGEFPLEIVERALLDHAADPVLLLAKAADCSWVTARELLELRDAERQLSAEDLRRLAEQYKKLKRETAPRPGIVPPSRAEPSAEAQRVVSG